MEVPALERIVTMTDPFDIRLTLRPLWRGIGDPAMRLAATEAWRATLTPEGPATVRVLAVAGGVQATAWGPGAGWAIDAAPALLGADDDPSASSALASHHPLVRELARRFAGLRIGRTGRVLEALVPTILEQKVTGQQASRAWRELLRRYGEPAPGPGAARGLRVPPAPATLAALPYFAFHPLGVEQRRADTIRRVATRAGWLEEATALPLDDASARLRAIPGVGSWTAAEVAARALGDPDAVSVGDFHLAHLVCWALAGEPRGTDERMLELLAPYAGERGRVIRLLEASGIRAPAYGPRLAPHRIERE